LSYFKYFKELNFAAKSFLDVGMASDIVLDHAKEFGYEELYGNDINPYVNSKYNIIRGNIEDVDIPNVDVIWASHVVEHFKDPIAACKKLYDKLNPAGIFFVAMPDPWFIRWEKVYDWRHWALREHHIMWDMDSFIDEMEKLGFKCKFYKRNALAGYIYYGDYNLVFQK
jgi:SAM-dependent methyltransferase